MSFRTQLLLLIVIFSVNNVAQAQKDPPTNPPAASSPDAAETHSHVAKPPETSTTDQLKETFGKVATQTEEEAAKIARRVDQDPQAKKAAAGILQPIYAVAEALAFPAFHWLAFALMSAGVFSYVLQLGLGKLVVLMRLGFSFKEIASDAIGLAISIVGLVLTTQAAAENSNFTQSPAAVISATAVGAIVGIILYFWGQSQELEAAAGRSRTAPSMKK